MAYIHIIMGNMFCGKTTELIRQCQRYESIGKRVLVVNHALDTRCGDAHVSTHTKCTHSAVKVPKLSKLDFAGFDVIAIDEAQFFEDLYDFVKKVESNDIHVIIAGLDGDYKREKFGEILDCVPLADSVTKLTSFCVRCKNGTLAPFTHRCDAESNKDVVKVGGSESYVPLCRKCYVASI